MYLEKIENDHCPHPQLMVIEQIPLPYSIDADDSAL